MTSQNSNDPIRISKSVALLKEIYTDTKLTELRDKLTKYYNEEYETVLYFENPTISETDKQSVPAQLHIFLNINLAILFSDKFYVKDPFFEGTLFGNMFEWYNNVNPGFKPMKDNKRPMIEYKTLIATMIKNLICCLLFKKMPVTYIFDPLNDLTKETKQKIKTLLMKIETMLNMALPYLYTDIIDIIKEYMLIFESNIFKSSLTDTPEKKEQLEMYDRKQQYKCEHEFKVFDILLNSPYIIFPSFYMHNYMKVILTMKLPLINFYLTNTDHKIHDIMSGICVEIYHDIRGHYYIMNLRIFEIIFFGRSKYYDLELVNNYLDIKTSFESWQQIIDKINNSTNILIVQDYFNFFNKLITIIQASIQEFKDLDRRSIYDFMLVLPKELYNSMWVSKHQYKKIKEEFKKKFIRYDKFVPLILFYFLHESYKLYSFYTGTLNKDTLISVLTNFYKNITNSIPIICTGNNYYKFLNEHLELNIPMDSSDSVHTRQIIEIINYEVYKILRKLQKKLNEEL